MSLGDALAQGRYLDPQYSMVSIYAHSGNGPNCDNYWLFTAQADQLGWCDPSYIIRFWDDCKIVYGLFARFPTRKGDDISKDEIIAAAYLSEWFAKQIEMYGSHNLWSFDLKRPWKFTLGYWIGRYPDVAPYVQSRAGVSVWWTARFSWAVGCVLATMSKKDITDGKILMLLQVTWMRRYWICRLAADFFICRMRKQYPGGPKELRAGFFTQGHPLVDFSPTSWDQF